VADPILKVTRLNKSFGAVQVLHDIDFAVYPGEVTALVGDNGAGKSTLVKCVAGINSIDTGTIEWEGRAVHITSPSVASHLGIEFVYQGPRAGRESRYHPEHVPGT
jgi:D-xylose transport system ATP-binding protein